MRALIAVEDIRFEDHSGIDARGLLRAIVKRGMLRQKGGGGGSTITQQLAKQLYSPKADNVIERLLQKPIEWVIAIKLERYYTKEEIRTLATTLDLPISQKKDSQEICFIPDDDYIRFLETHHHDKLSQKGIFCDQGGTILGQHHGAYHYTIGQRKGLGLALGYPAYVTGIDSAKGIVTIGRDEDLWHDRLIATEVKSFGNVPTSGSALVKIRSRDTGALADYHYHDDKLYVTFKEKVRAITPGQSVVLYDGEKLIGSGIIEKTPY